MTFDATPFLRLYAKWRNAQLANQDYSAVQEQQLLKLVKTARGTRFGTQHGFSTIGSVEDFQSRVPLRRYEDFWRDYWRAAFPKFSNVTWPGTVGYLAVSSGTSSGTTKYLPITQEMVNSNAKAGLDLLIYHMNHFPESRLFGGKNFILGGSTDLVQESPGTWSGDLSGIAVKTLPWWAKSRYFPPPELALMKNWEEKIDVLARQSLTQDIRLLSGVPAWMLIFFDKLNELRPHAQGKLSEIYPNLEMIVHGGVKFDPYLDIFKRHIEGSKIELREVYPASEGFIAVQDRGHFEGMRLVLDHGIFFEFVPVEELDSPNPTRHWVKNIEPNINYAVVMTTCAGLWSYIIGDTVRFVDTRPPRLFVTGRTSYYLSAFGEHLIQEEIEQAVATAAREIHLEVTDYSVGPIFPKSAGELGGHQWVVEFSPRQPSQAEIQKFSAVLDDKLCKLNEDYQAHRSNNFGLLPPQILVARHSLFKDWMQSRGKLGGQNKVPRIINDQALLDSLVKFAV